MEIIQDSATLASPQGATARVEEVLGGTRVTLRPCGAGRWAGIVFLSVWLVGWACGELFALGFLTTLAGSALRFTQALSLPSGAAAVVTVSFLLVWLVLWTFGGATAIVTVCRSIWGRDILTIGPRGWTLWQGVGPWGRTRQLDPSDVQQVALRRKGGVLVAEMATGSLTLSALGTRADRQWLRDRLRRAVGLDSTGGSSPSSLRRWRPAGPAVPPPGYESQILRDGTTRVAATSRQRLGQIVGVLLLTFFWNGIVGIFILSGFAAAAVKTTSPAARLMTPGSWEYWLFLTPFLVVGIGFLGGFLWTASSREEWWLSPSRMEIRRMFLGRVWAWRCTNAVLALTVTRDREGDECWRLVVEGQSKPRILDTGDPARLRTLGFLLAERTGWDLREDSGD